LDAKFPVTIYDIVGLALGEKVEGYCPELHACPALQKKNLVIVAYAHKLGEQRLSLVMYLLVNLGAMAHFGDGHPAVVVVDEVALSLKFYFLGQCSGPGGKIIYLHNFSFRVC